jgi:Xaa-Pro aminopeptidase
MGSSADKLTSLRSLMAERGFDAFFIPRADEYLGEYIPPRNERLHWLTGFTGSAGAAVVLADSAAIFVDGRYTVQVRTQVDTDDFVIHHLIDDPPIEWLVSRLDTGARVACDPRLHSYEWFLDSEATLHSAGIELFADADNLVDRCWDNRPEVSVAEGLLLGEQYTGESSTSKRQRIGGVIAEAGCDAALVFAPDSVSWLLNIRGMDMPQLPVLLSFALLDPEGDLALFVDSRRLPPGFSAHVGPGVEVFPEEAFADLTEDFTGKRVLADPVTANAWSQLTLAKAGAILCAQSDPVLLPKACKNSVEVSGTITAHLRDAVAETRFLAWLDREVDAGRLYDEAILADKLLAFRQEAPEFHACSFDTISAAGSNAAMCHYNHLDAVPAKVPMNSVYLCDSGAQYPDGTTDITRTVAIGDPGAEVRRLFTLVLKGHIALDQARFPTGTTGMQLDTLARQFLWAEGFDYDHGTGHGVGVFLSVHEGPQRISKTAGEVALRPGMIVSNEPGYYRDGQFGIRCENLVLVVQCESVASETPMLGFEALTLVPFDTRLLDISLMTAAEINWLDDYHQRVLQTVGPLLEGDDLAWITHATLPVQA